MSYQIIFTDELYHHGIKGQRWGVRRFQNEDGSLTAAGKARYDIKEAKHEYKRAKKALRRAQRDVAWRGNGSGIKAIANYERLASIRDKAKNQAEEKRLDVLQRKADKIGLTSKKKEFNKYVKEMKKTGLVNSRLDKSKGGRSKRLYDRLSQTKGKKYADRVQRKVEDKIATDDIIRHSAAAGLMIASAYSVYLATKIGKD